MPAPLQLGGSSNQATTSSTAHNVSTTASVIPDDITIWQFFFESRYSPLSRHEPQFLGGYLDAATGSLLSYIDIAEHATYLSTAISHKYGVAPGNDVVLFVKNQYGIRLLFSQL
jgi:hypothetical protein